MSMPATPQTDVYICPQCRSNKVKISYPCIECLACGWSEPLIDYPISWDWHRYYCREYGQPDPGPCEPPEHSIEELHERVLALEERPQLIEKPRLEVDRPHEKPELAAGVRL